MPYDEYDFFLSTQGPVDMAAEIKSEVRMTCSVLWDPQFDLFVSWKKDNVDIDFVDGGRFSVDESDQSLIIRDLRFEDQGE